MDKKKAILPSIKDNADLTKFNSTPIEETEGISRDSIGKNFSPRD